MKNKKLPVGIFDSGTGGLTVMDAIVNFDGFNNQNKKQQKCDDEENANNNQQRGGKEVCRVRERN